MAIAQSACADQFDTVNFTLSDAFTYDANVFRTPDSAGPQTGSSSKGDRFNTLSAGINLDKPYSLQRFQAAANKTRTTYETISSLNADTFNYRAAWLWSVTPHVTGVLGTDRTQAQVSFAQTGGTQRNLRTTTNNNFTFDGWVSGAWHLLGGISSSASVTEQTLLSQPSVQSHRSEGGLRYVARSGNTVSFVQRYIPAETVNQPLDPVNLIETNYRDTESELRVNWKVTGKSIFDGTLNHKVRINEHFAQRNFSGVAAELRYSWTPTGKLAFNLTAGRNLSPYAAFGNTLENSTYRVDRTIALESIWQTTAKTTMRVNLSRALADFRGPVFALSSPIRNDDLRIARLSVDWTPRRFLSFSASVERDQRDSNIASFQFSDTVATLNGVLAF